MRIEIPLLVSVVAMLSLGCGSASKEMASDTDTRKLDELVSGRHFVIDSDWALPLATNSLNSIANAGLLPPGSSASQINLIGNTNYLKVMGDSVAVYLPYYGERQFGGGYNNDGPGIEFEGVPEDLEFEKDEEKQRYDIRFRMTDDSETFKVTVTLFPNLDSMINVNSSQRFPIRYSGSVQAIPKEERDLNK